MDLEIEINKSINEESSHIVDDSSDLPLTIGITSDGANVLRGKKDGVYKKIKDIANQLMLKLVSAIFYQIFIFSPNYSPY